MIDYETIRVLQSTISHLLLLGMLFYLFRIFHNIK